MVRVARFSMHHVDGVLELTRTTGFVGLALADQLEYGATFGPQSSQ